VKRVLFHLVAVLLVGGGAGLLTLYALMMTDRVGDLKIPRDAASIAGFGMAAVIAGVLMELPGVVFRGRRFIASVRFPAIWVSATLFAVVLAGGWLTIRLDTVPALEPVLVVLGVLAIFALIGRIVTRWTPGRSAPTAVVFRAAAWGMMGATTSAIIMQGLVVLVAIFGVVGGLAMVDTNMVRDFADRMSREGSLDQFSGSVVGTATVAIGIVGMYALVAPLTEELTKLVGVALVMRRLPLSPYTAFIAGVSSGLGFSVVETLGYALAAGKSWPLLLGVRAPVAFIHVTASALAALGWYQQQTRGGYRMVFFYVAAVLVHGAWNGLTAAIMVASSFTGGGNNIDTSVALIVFGIVMVMGLVLTGCIAWTTMTARTLGQRWFDGEHPPYVHARSLPARGWATERSPSLPGVPRYEV
jgi:RsiW-degrading membrane proteinase PrsW (M82 family)